MSVDRDVVIVGGGVAGPSAGVFAARADLDTLAFDRGISSIGQCAHLGNYLGFPGGVSPETFRDLAHAHLRRAGCVIRERHVSAVRRTEALPASDARTVDATAGGFRVETADGALTTRRVVAATKCDASYLEPLDERGELFAADEGGSSSLDPESVDADGRTAVEGLYVAGPLGGAPDQAMIAAGHGARVGRTLVRDHLRDRGYWPEAAECYYDWRTPETAHETGWDESFGAWLRETAPADADPARVERVVRETVERERRRSLASAEARRRAENGQRAVLEQLSDEIIREHLADTAGH